MHDLKHATMTTEARAIVTVRGYSFFQTSFWTASVEPSSPFENDVREPDCVRKNSLCEGEWIVKHTLLYLALPVSLSVEVATGIDNMCLQDATTDDHISAAWVAHRL